MKLYGLHRYEKDEDDELLVASRKVDKLIEYYENLETDAPLVNYTDNSDTVFTKMPVIYFYITELEVI